MTCLIINNSAITKQEKIQQQTMRNQALFQPTTTTLPTPTVKNEEEKKTLFNNWHESFYDTNYNQPDNSTLLTTNKRSPFENIEKRKKKRKLEREDVLFGPMPTIVASPLPCDRDDLLLNDEKILEELERITADDDNTAYPLSPPTSPLLLSSHHFEEPDNDFILFP
ncbi:hypothetical protein G6F46_003647 [Rhizopus delemar]|uniref:Uncharacterized protein n=2 Tax=Rhizopus TaxID=4842 RepID=A0A9P6Z829_9FUNG|nr:hypothetical protein G6F55_001504 [Rhizopus delemar]KAG1548153.1 hypothetical protein G6F51_003837 [Rhizopus arrhizus]KAG1503083.1 hypothetical protein G6F54_001918 [Rhizopus delemar]KAG1518152.1 hypothetical protein G6F53_000820 [Rhizopus delemar]KAG1524223.1 hypothetical protein G6F52_004365 [Rhizopus delemar]